MPKLTSLQIQTEFFDRMILIEHILPLVTTIHVEDLQRDLPDGWTDLLESRDFADLAKKHFGKKIDKDGEAEDLFEVLGQMVGNGRGLPLGVFVAYKIPVIHEVRANESISHAGFGNTYTHWLYFETFGHDALEAIIADAEIKRAEQIRKLKLKKAAAV